MNLFRITVKGKNSVSDRVSEAAMALLQSHGVEPVGDDWDEKMETEIDRLMAIINRYVVDGRGGNDAVTLDFDMAAGTCAVVPVDKAEERFFNVYDHRWEVRDCATVPRNLRKSGFDEVNRLAAVKRSEL